jgi:steroid 5-alpha reductase family enzyme
MFQDVLRLALADAALVFGSFIALWFVSMAVRDSSLVDIWFAPCIGFVALLGYLLGEGVESRRLLMLVLVGLWAARLGGYLAWRNWGREDPRYARLRKHVEEQGGNFAWHSFTRINLFQASTVFVATAPIVVAQSAAVPPTLGVLAWAGAALCVIGIAFEGVADLQLTRFKADPANQGRVLDTGLWRYSRHPNYFGETCVWWGFWLVACEHPWGVFTVFAPALMTWSILGMMGKELLERRMKKKRPGYEAYIARTSGFFPWPPKAAPRER